MKILVACDKFKDSLSSLEVNRAIVNGINSLPHNHTISSLAMADGGEGTLDVIYSVSGGRKIAIPTVDPLLRPISSEYIYHNDSAFIELALSSGMQHLNFSERNPMNTTSFGTGILIKDAINRGAKTVNLFLGGSATNDCGIGILAALGYEFYDEKTKLLKPVGRNLVRVSSIKKPNEKFFNTTDFNVFCDVSNPLYGQKGAAQVFGKQKGANENEIKILDDGLRNISRFFDFDFNDSLPYCGAAGGIAGGLYGFLGAKLSSGMNYISGLVGLEERIKSADIIISGEGKIDAQSFNGKMLSTVLDLVARHNKKLILVAGSIDPTLVFSDEILLALSISDITTSKVDSMQNADKYLGVLGLKLVNSLNV